MRPVWLIAAREFRTYAATGSFWLALLIGPLLVGGAALVFSAPPRTMAIRIVSDDPGLRSEVAAAVLDAARLDGRSLTVGDSAGLKVQARMAPPDRLDVTFDRDFPLSQTARTLVVRTLERDRLRASAAAPGVAVIGHQPIGPKDAASAAGGGRFAVVMMLWLTLTGSLGMLLQAVVRERANRSLELLLASAQPWQVVLGKVAGVGLVSLCVLLAWLGSVGLVAASAPGAGLQPLLAAVGDPIALTRALLVYLFGFAFYGLLTVALGARARDTATAQNLSRPMFAVLLVAFFVAMSAAGQPSPPLWLTLAPPFAPFLLLMRAPSPLIDGLALILLAGGAVVVGAMAVARLQVAPAPSLYRSLFRLSFAVHRK